MESLLINIQKKEKIVQLTTITMLKRTIKLIKRIKSFVAKNKISLSINLVYLNENIEKDKFFNEIKIEIERKNQKRGKTCRRIKSEIKKSQEPLICIEIQEENWSRRLKTQECLIFISAQKEK